MTPLTREELDAKRAEYVAQLEKLNNDINAVSGAIQAVDQLKALLEEKESAGKSGKP